MIIDEGVWANFASTIMVEKLRLPMIKHPRPYNLQWLNVDGVIRVDQQVLISFSIGRYKDEVLCDVVPMQAGHMLLGNPWEYNRRVTHNSISNKYSFKMNERVITLAPLPPNQAREDQQKLQRESEQKRVGKQKKEENGEKNKKSEDEKKESNERKKVENESSRESNEKESERKIKTSDEVRETEVKEREKETLVVSSENEFERRQKNCYARASEVKRVIISANNLNSYLHISTLSLSQGIEIQHEGEVESVDDQPILDQAVGKFSKFELDGKFTKLELESCFPKKLMGFKTQCGPFEWLTKSLSLNNALMSLKNQILEPFLGKSVLKGFDHLNFTLSCSNSNLRCCLSISLNDQLFMMSFDALTANLKKCTRGMNETTFLFLDECSVGTQVVAKELSSIASMELTKFERDVMYGEKQGIAKPAMEARRIFEKGKDRIQAKGLELKIDEVEHVDFIGVNKYDFHPRYQPGSFFSELRRIEKKHGLNLNEFYFSREVKRRKHSTYINPWHGGSKSIKYKFQQRVLLDMKFRSNAKVGKDWLNQVMRSQDSRTNLLEEEGYDVIQPSYKVHSIKKSWDERSFVDDQAFHGVLKDRAWKFKRKLSLKTMNKACYGIPKDWAWKFKKQAWKF